MKNLKFILAISTFLFFAKSGNGQVYYEIEDGFQTRIRQPNELKVSIGGFRQNLDYRGNANFQIGYSPIKNIGLVGSYFHILDNTITFNKDRKTTYSAFFGVGFYKMFSKKKRKNSKQLKTKQRWNLPSKYILIDAYLGYGVGKIKLINSLGWDAKMIYHRPVIQVGFHLLRQNIGFDFAIRYGAVNFQEINISSKIPPYDFQTFQNLAKFPNKIFTATSTRVFVRLKAFDVFFNQNYKFGHNQRYSNYYYRFFNFNVGFVFKIPLKKK